MKVVVHINKFFSFNLWSIGEKEFLLQNFCWSSPLHLLTFPFAFAGAPL